MNEKIQEIIDFFELVEGYDKTEEIENIISEIKELKGYSSDEIGLEWDGTTLMVLNDFALAFYEKSMNRVCNVVRSFDDEEGDNQ